MELWRADGFQRPANLDDPQRNNGDVLYAKSYLLTRMVVGVLGVALPLGLIIGEAYFLKSGVHVRGSISAYYHSPMRDLFVGILCVVGVLLSTYMYGQGRRTDFWLTLVSGVAVILVAIFPTKRSGLSEGAALCGSSPGPPGCAPIQQAWGETLVATIHYTSAFVFIVSLAAACFYFAHLEKVTARRRNIPVSPVARLQRLCGAIIVAAVAWVAVGGLLDIDVWELTPLYLGEVVAVWAFGASWLASSRDLWKRLPQALRSGIGARGANARP